MTATDELRRLLDELGVKWEAPVSFDGTARYDTVAGGYWFHEFNGKITIHGLTPEQAIAATLGAGTCKAIPTGCATAICSECGAEYMGSIMTNEPPDYVKALVRCPNCGREVIGE